MKYVILLMLLCKATYTMQPNAMSEDFIEMQKAAAMLEELAKLANEKSKKEIELLRQLADERSDLSLNDFQKALPVLTFITAKHDKILLTKALWGIARAWHNSYGTEGLALAEILIQAGADPGVKIEIANLIPLNNKDGKGFSYTSIDSHETTVLDIAQGNLKRYLQDRRK